MPERLRSSLDLRRLVDVVIDVGMIDLSTNSDCESACSSTWLSVSCHHNLDDGLLAHAAILTYQSVLEE